MVWDCINLFNESDFFLSNALTAAGVSVAIETVLGAGAAAWTDAGAGGVVLNAGAVVDDVTVREVVVAGSVQIGQAVAVCYKGDTNQFWTG